MCRSARGAREPGWSCAPCASAAWRCSRSSSRAGGAPLREASGASAGASTWSRSPTTPTACRAAAPTCATAASATWSSSPGGVDAMVAGRELYHVVIRIRKLKRPAWKAIRAACAGQIGSVLELLRGRLSDRVMEIVTDRDTGLFPKPGEIKLACDCPDWATMCKHAAAVLYGVGARLDRSPELLFRLRGVDEAELIAADLALPGGAASADTLADDDLGSIFGIELDAGEGVPAPGTRKPPAPGGRKRKKPKKASATTGSARRRGARVHGHGGWRRPGVGVPPHGCTRRPAARALRLLGRRVRRLAQSLGRDGAPLGSRARTARSAIPPAGGPDDATPRDREARRLIPPFRGFVVLTRKAEGVFCRRTLPLQYDTRQVRSM